MSRTFSSEDTRSFCSVGGVKASLRVPRGWVVYGGAQMQNGDCLTFYPNEEPKEMNSTSIHANWTAKDQVDFKIYVATIVELEQSAHAGVNVSNSRLDTIESSGHSVILRHLESRTVKRYDEVAYIDTGNGLLTLTLATKSKSAHEKNMSAFEQVLKSIQWIDHQSK